MSTETDGAWKATLTPEQYHMLREHGTEHRGSRPYTAQWWIQPSK